jgi:hypothetical protein
MRCLGFVLAVAVFGLANGLAHGAAAQGVVPSEHTADASSFSSELRFRIFTNAFRWSSYTSEVASLPDSGAPGSGRRSLHGVFGLGARFYPKGGHGVLVDADYRVDIDVDSSAGWFCLFECPPQLWTEFAVAHAGYAYRHIIPSPGKRGRRAWAFTPHASVAAGASFSEASHGVLSYYGTYRSAVVGARLGLDIDLHFKRFFMGWTLRYEFLKHTKGPLRLTHFLSYNLIPVFAIGVVLGAEVHEQSR